MKPEDTVRLAAGETEHLPPAPDTIDDDNDPADLHTPGQRSKE